MRSGWQGVVGMLAACGGAVLWAIGLAVLEPDSEPAKPWHELASNNSYWVRDVRCMAILVVLAGLVLAFRGARRLSALSALGAVGWLGADLWLDRIDVAGWSAAGWLAAIACALIIGAVLAGRTVRAEPSRGLLFVTASVAAALVPIAGVLESPTDTEPGLTPSAVAAGALLTVVMLGCALATPPALDSSRIRAAATLLVLSAGCLVVLRSLPVESRFPPAMLLGAALLTGVAVTAWQRSGPVTRRDLSTYGVVGIGALIGYPAAIMITLLVTAFAVPVSAPLTALAGNPPVNGADTDVLLTLVGLLAGLAIGVPLARGARVEDAEIYVWPGTVPHRPGRLR